MFHFTDNSRHLGYTCSDSSSGLSYELLYSAGLTNFSYQLSVEVSLVTMPPKRTIKSFFKTASKRTCQHIENETAVNEGEVGGGGLIKMECPISFSALPLFILLRHCCILNDLSNG